MAKVVSDSLERHALSRLHMRLPVLVLGMMLSAAAAAEDVSLLWDGASGFPTLSWRNSNYWVDVVFE